MLGNFISFLIIFQSGTYVPYCDLPRIYHTGTTHNHDTSEENSFAPSGIYGNIFQMFCPAKYLLSTDKN